MRVNFKWRAIMISFRLFMLWVFILIAVPVFSEAQAQKERNLLSSNYTQKEIATTLVPTKEWVPYPKYSDRQAWSSKSPEHLQEAYIEEGEKYLGYRWPNVTATDYLEFVRSGNRQIMQKPYNKKIEALEALVMAELMEGKGRFIDDI